MSLTLNDERWMRRALDLALRGQHSTWPNPMVGCVVVENGQILGEGWHRRFGEAHAEVNALSAVPETADLSNATAYVTLEPCSHTGKTPPCADLLVRRRVGRVVVATTDPNPQVSGRGTARLLESGVQVVVGCLEPSARLLNRRFMHAMTSDRPWVTLKWAQSKDGYLDPEERAAWGRGGHALTGLAARRWTHGLRAQHDGIVVGMRTLLVDRPSLTTRDVLGRSPRRFVVTSGATAPPRDWQSPEAWSDKNPTWLIHGVEANPEVLEAWHAHGLTPLGLSEPVGSLGWWKALKTQTGLAAALVEGGGELLRTLSGTGQVDEVHRLTAPTEVGNGVPAPSTRELGDGESRFLGVDLLESWVLR
jgi:diaminohydroxyphosphoribosylaminopyrimidine deaminase / 5-amino-6-(5-phosphoribosylamino)uracil reductase